MSVAPQAQRVGRPPLLRVAGVTRKFGDHQALDGIDLEVEEGEFFALLGASGSGKSTLLRVLAGLTTPDQGQVHLDGRDMTGLAPHARAVNMMFQSYALFPHMSVAANIGFGLKQEGRRRRDIADAVGEALDLVRLSGFGPRNPAGLSGGERQRVALARCLVKRPRLLLLDEPLAALDKRLREQTRHELVALQQKLRLTVIMVTHDQDEALSLASRIAIMQAGRLVQIGTPRAVYTAPVSVEVAGLIGSVNLVQGQVVGRGRDTATIRVDGFAKPIKAPGGGLAPGSTVTLALRPENIALSKTAPKPTGDNGQIPATVETAAYLGHRLICRVRLENRASWEVAVDPSGREPALRAADGPVWLQWRLSDLMVFAQGASTVPAK